MKILLLGCAGQVGWELQRSLAVLGEVVALDRRSTPLCGDIGQLQALAQTVRTVRPDVIVNAAAHTAVDRAEGEPELARLLNAAAPGVLAQEALALDALLVHYSSDYVFDGSGTAPRDEQAPVAPLSVYGQTKLEGEQAIQASGCRHLIFRTSWVYAARGVDPAGTKDQMPTATGLNGLLALQLGLAVHRQRRHRSLFVTRRRAAAIEHIVAAVVHQQRIQGQGLLRQHTRGRRIQQARQFGFAFGAVHGRVGRGIDDHVRAHRAHGLRQGLQLADVAAQRRAAAVQGHHLAQHRQAALQLPADLARAAQQQDLHAGSCALYCWCTQSR